MQLIWAKKPAAGQRLSATRDPFARYALAFSFHAEDEVADRLCQVAALMRSMGEVEQAEKMLTIAHHFRIELLTSRTTLGNLNPD